ncbi:MAG: NUDIX domain-containing protein [Firmicutes bacterium]|jgi:8-oxo-dGTP diphosphatase|nr:NUDIX domain-containing protein [Bacillota bacterium]
MKPVRVSVKAVIIQDGKLLVTQNADPWGIFYLLPGGGQTPGESLHEALIRECREEIGVDVEIGDLVFVRDYIARNHEFAEIEPDVHQIELMFLCALPENQVPHNGVLPDANQISVEWLSLLELEAHRIYPRAIKRCLVSPIRTGATYLGDVN